MCTNCGDINIRKMCKFTAVLLIVVLVLFVVCAQVSPLVTSVIDFDPKRVTLKTLDAGTFIGQRVADMEQEDNALPKSYFAFRGIPYATPPLGLEGRWKAPSPPEVRRQPRVATEYKPMCSQWDEKKGSVVGSQDCLYLNIFTPYVPSTERRPTPLLENVTSWTIENRNLLPVLVYVHGGEFIAGSGNFYGPERFMKENVVLVTFNYRLGLLGFLTNGEESLPGNYGLLDQLEALRWIKQNIYRFGGNPLRTCVFGNVDHLLLARGAKGLFQSAILSPLSTSPLFAPTLTPPEGSLAGAKDFLHLVAREAGCFMRNEAQLVECLQVAQPESLIRVQHRVLKFFHYPRYPGLAPVTDSWADFPLLPDEPQVLLQQGQYLSTVPLMVGISGYEGFNAFFEFYLKLGPYRQDILKEREFLMEKLESILKVMLGVAESGEEFHRVFLSVWNLYFRSDVEWPPVEKVLWKLFRIFGDLTVNSGHRKLVQLLSSKNKAPVFNFIFNSSIHKFQTYLGQRLASHSSHNSTRIFPLSLHSVDIPPWKDLYYLFQPLNQNQKEEADTTNTTTNFTQEEESLSNFLVKLYISFANYGSPKQVMGSKGKVKVESKWARATDSNSNYFVLGLNSYPMNSEFRKAESKFWLAILPTIRDLSQQITELEGYPLLFWIFVGLTVTLVFISILLILFICSSCCRKKKRSFGDDTVVFLKRIPAS